MTRKPKSRRASDEDDYLGVDDADEQPPVGDDGWPTNAPVLTAGDMIWNWTTASGRRDLAEWMESTFDAGLNLTPRRDEAYGVLCGVISERFGREVTSLWIFCEFCAKNKKPGFEWQAACWNEMLHRLGYAVAKAARKDPGYNKG